MRPRARAEISATLACAERSPGGGELTARAVQRHFRRSPEELGTTIKLELKLLVSSMIGAVLSTILSSGRLNGQQWW